MSKMTDMLKKANGEKENSLFSQGNRNQGEARFPWAVWFIVLAVILVGFYVFRYIQDQKNKELTDVFPEEVDQTTNEIQYEFYDNGEQVPTATTPVAQNTNVVEPASSVTPIAETVSTTAEVPASAPTAPAVTTGQKFYSIQVLSFKDMPKAQKAADDLKAKGYQAFAMEKNLAAKGTVYRVYVGQFAQKSEAVAYWESFKKSYPNSFVISVN